jgi:hypothetical protein
MMSAYVVVALVFGMVLSYLWLIHRLWLRSVFREDDERTVPTNIVRLSDFGVLYSPSGQSSVPRASGLARQS